MTDLSDSVVSLRNSVVRAGTFSTVYPETTAGDLLQYLRDGFAECQLDGIMGTCADDGTGVITPDIPNGSSALVVLVAAIRFFRAELSNRTTSVKYVAGPASYETTTATNVLRDIMKAMETQRDKILLIMRQGNVSKAFGMADQYLMNVFAHSFDYWTDPLSRW